MYLKIRDNHVVLLFMCEMFKECFETFNFFLYFLLALFLVAQKWKTIPHIYNQMNE